MSEKLQRIVQENAQFEKKSPYNFCDRWCERCVHEKQIRCTLYKDELERKITCIAHGRDEDDPEVTKALLEEQYKDIDEKIGAVMDKFGINPDYPEIDEDELDEERLIDFNVVSENVQRHIKFVESNLLPATAEQYRKKTYEFLEETFYKDEKKFAKLNYDFQTVSWYHTLLSAKLQRALVGFREPVCEDEFGLYDAVAQFQICKKAITQSVEAFRKILAAYPVFRKQIKEMLALLHNIHSRIVAMEESV